MNLILALALFADPPTTARVLSQQFIHTTAPSNRRESQIQIGAVVYIADSVCKHTVVGHEYPGQLDRNHIVLQVGEKTCKYRIVGERVAQPSQ
jgi:hypothetical protein